MNNFRLSFYCIVFLAFTVPVLSPRSAQAFHACVTVPELASLVRAIGGQAAKVSVFAKGREDPHFVVPKPSYIKLLNRCDVYVQTGMDLESGWAPGLLQSARNASILPGGRAHIDASTVTTPLEVPIGPVTRLMGDIHSDGNPHYILDPMNGLRVAELLRSRFSLLFPEDEKLFNERYTSFRQELGKALVGNALAGQYDFEKLVILAANRELVPFLESQNEKNLLGGWLKEMHPHRGTKLIADHRIWPYFANFFGLTIISRLEPLPGIPPTTKHLNNVVGLINTTNIPALLVVSYYDNRYADFVADKTGVAVVQMAHQCDARPGTANYIDLIGYNVAQLSRALNGSGGQ